MRFEIGFKIQLKYINAKMAINNIKKIGDTAAKTFKNLDKTKTPIPIPQPIFPLWLFTQNE